jgi:hypothetical protein
MVTDTVDGVLIDQDDDGFYLVLSGGRAEYRFNVHAVAEELLGAAEREIGPWRAEGQAARAVDAVQNAVRRSLGWPVPLDIRDPKHPDHHDTLAEFPEDAA